MGVLNNLLAGKSIRAVLFRGNQLAIVLDDNTEVSVGWFTEDGEPVKGRPGLCKVGARLNAQSMNQLIAEAAPTHRLRPHGMPSEADRRLAIAAASQQHLLPTNYRN
jgi:hypothetical protein